MLKVVLSIPGRFCKKNIGLPIESRTKKTKNNIKGKKITIKKDESIMSISLLKIKANLFNDKNLLPLLVLVQLVAVAPWLNHLQKEEKGP